MPSSHPPVQLLQDQGDIRLLSGELQSDRWPSIRIGDTGGSAPSGADVLEEDVPPSGGGDREGIRHQLNQPPADALEGDRAGAPRGSASSGQEGTGPAPAALAETHPCAVAEALTAPGDCPPGRPEGKSRGRTPGDRGTSDDGEKLRIARAELAGLRAVREQARQALREAKTRAWVAAAKAATNNPSATTTGTAAPSAGDSGACEAEVLSTTAALESAEAGVAGWYRENAAVVGWGGLGLDAHHVQYLDERAVSPEIAGERGIRTVRGPGDVPEEFSHPQRALVSEEHPGLYIPGWTVDGKEVPGQLRPDRPRTTTRGVRPGGEPKVVKFENAKGRAGYLDVHPRMQATLADPAIPLIVTEGPVKADAAAGLGLAAIALRGVFCWRGTNPAGGKAELPDWDRVALNDRLVVIIFDSDIAVKKQVLRAAQRLAGMLERRGAQVQLRKLSEPDGTKRGLDDAIAAGMTVEESLTGVSAKEFFEDCVEDSKLGDAEVVGHVLEGYELGYSTTRELFAVPLAGSRRPRLINESFWEDISAEYWEAEGIAMSVGPGVKDPIRGLARRAPVAELHLRSANCAAGLVIALGDEDDRLVVVTADGWSVVTPAEADEEFLAGLPLFRAAEGQAPLPVPVQGGSADRLRTLLGYAAESDEWFLVLGFLVAEIFPDADRIFVLFKGSYGSGKTARAWMVTNVWDPAEDLSGPPGDDERSDRAYAMGRFILGFDNLTEVTQKASDWLCRLATGVAEHARALYTDSELLLFSYSRAAVLTALQHPKGLKPDALDRFIVLKCPLIPRGTYRGRAAGKREFRAAHAEILGCLLDLAAGALRHLPTVRRQQETTGRILTSRMADYEAVLIAVDRHLAEAGQPARYHAAYSRHIRAVVDEMASEDQLVQHIRKYLDGLGGKHWPCQGCTAGGRNADGRRDSRAGTCARESWLDFERQPGAMISDLHGSLIGEGLPLDRDWFPRQPKGLAGAIRAKQAYLSAAGIKFREKPGGGHHPAQWWLWIQPGEEAQ